MLEIVIAVIGSGVLSTIINVVFSVYKEHRKKEDGVTKGVRQLLYERIKFLGMRHISHGYISTKDLEDIIMMHNTYHDDLGGNGYLDSIMNQVKKLPIRADAE